MDKHVTVIIGVGGMGIAIARRVGSGRALLLGDLDTKSLEAAAAQLRAEGHDVTTRPVDVADGESVATLAGTATNLGHVSQIIHTAGVSPAQASAEQILRVDLLGVAQVVDEFGGVVAPGGAGVVIASMAGHRLATMPVEQELALADTPAAHLLSLPFVEATLSSARSAYWLSKRGNQLRVQASAARWGERGARINSISPGMVSTPMGQQELDGPGGDRMRAAVAESAARRFATPDDIASACAFLVSAEAGFITGADLLVDGGVTAIRAREARMAIAG
ncbi:SDR family oxidoreductase [Amycolatopsis sp. NPDC051372]|uniref:SDR family oxidoreductase n=1 Tax=Amycolatopsis sp. NPDC051372 TaxID=3155669 RepID=UPI003433E9FB